MEIDTLFGLPAHPLFVHTAVVLLPIAAIGLIVERDRTTRRRSPRQGVAQSGDGRADRRVADRRRRRDLDSDRGRPATPIRPT